MSVHQGSGKIDISILEAIVAESYRTMTAGTYDLRAREGLPRRPMSDRLVREEVERPSLRDSLRPARHPESAEDAVGV
jgi:hypothetical protein